MPDRYYRKDSRFNARKKSYEVRGLEIKEGEEKGTFNLFAYLVQETSDGPKWLEISSMDGELVRLLKNATHTLNDPPL